MRKLAPLFIVLVLLSGFVSIMNTSAYSSHRYQKRDTIDSLEAFSKFILECVKKNDFKSYSKRFPTKAQVLNLIAIARAADSTRFTNEDYDGASVDQKIDEQFSKLKPGFEKTYTDGNAKGIDWKKVVYTRTVYEIGNEPGFVTAKVHIRFTYAGEKYELYLRDLLLIGKRWYNFSKMSLDEDNDWDHDIDTVIVDSPDPRIDTVAVAVDSSGLNFLRH